MVSNTLWQVITFWNICQRDTSGLPLLARGLNTEYNLCPIARKYLQNYTDIFQLNALKACRKATFLSTPIKTSFYFRKLLNK
jgi:hypothetical protein